MSSTTPPQTPLQEDDIIRPCELLHYLDLMYDAYRDRHDGQQLPADLKTHYAYRSIRSSLERRDRNSRQTAAFMRQVPPT